MVATQSCKSGHAYGVCVCVCMCVCVCVYVCVYIFKLIKQPTKQ